MFAGFTTSGPNQRARCIHAAPKRAVARAQEEAGAANEEKKDVAALSDAFPGAPAGTSSTTVRTAAGAASRRREARGGVADPKRRGGFLRRRKGDAF